MKGSSEIYQDQSRRLKHWDYSTPGGYYVTICTQQRRLFFGTIEKNELNLSPVGEIVTQEWLKTASLRESVELDEFVVMPNHFHGIIFLKQVVGTGVQKSEETKLISLGLIISQFKSACTRRIRANFVKDFAWQSRFYDHVIRDEIDLQRIRIYIRDNPMKWALDKYYCKDG
jgi:putative transposase